MTTDPSKIPATHPRRASAESDFPRDVYFAALMRDVIDPCISRWLASTDGPQYSRCVAVTGGRATNFHMGLPWHMPTLDWDIAVCAAHDADPEAQQYALEEVGADLAGHLSSCMSHERCAARAYYELCDKSYVSRWDGSTNLVGHVFALSDEHGSEAIVDIVISDKGQVLDVATGIRYVSLEWLVDDMIDIVNNASSNTPARIGKARRKLTAFDDFIDTMMRQRINSRP